MSDNSDSNDPRDDLQPGVYVHDSRDGRHGQVASRYTSRNVEGPVREVVVDFDGSEVSFINEQRDRLTVVPS